MKILFVCRQNVGRSQMAKAFYNILSKTNDADAAGTHVIERGQTLLERKATSESKNFFVIDVMKDAGLDIAAFTRHPLEESVLDKYDRIISMANEADTPKWLLKSPKYTHWDVKDPRGQDYETTAKVRDDIKLKVSELI